MKINSITPYNPYNNTYYSKSNIPKNQTPFTGKEQIPKKIYPWVISGLLTIGGIYACAIGKISGTDNSKGFDVEYYNIKKETKDAVVSRFEKFKSNLPKDKDFLNGVTLVVTDKNSHLEDDYSFKTFLKNSEEMEYASGISFYSDKNIPRMIVIQEYPLTLHDDLFLLTKSGENSITPLLYHSLIHEIGHQFDEYFGHDHDEKYARSFDSLMFIKEQDPFDNPYVYGAKSKKEKNIIETYSKKNGLSDTENFKNAILKDFQYISKIKRTTPGYLPMNIDYYTQGVNISSGITRYDVDMADIARNEVYANLFSYAFGENDGDRSQFLRVFPNSYKVVINDIKKYLGDDILQK